eukprot:scaffold102559_cov57-Phaeocystis_antarctica.AAC.5
MRPSPDPPRRDSWWRGLPGATALSPPPPACMPALATSTPPPAQSEYGSQASGISATVRQSSPRLQRESSLPGPSVAPHPSKWGTAWPWRRLHGCSLLGHAKFQGEGKRAFFSCS